MKGKPMTQLDLTTVHKCCICDGDIEHHKTEEGETYWTRGHNAQPIKEGQCCDSCNSTIVLPRATLRWLWFFCASLPLLCVKTQRIAERPLRFLCVVNRFF